MSDVFISYSRKDIAFARLIRESLLQSKIDIWIDWERIPIGQKWWDEICQAIENANVFLFIISKNSIGSPVCKDEINYALKNHKRIIPILVDNLKPDVIKEFAPELPQINWIIFERDRIFRLEKNPAVQSDKPEDQEMALPLPPHFEEALGKLGTAIHTDWEWVKFHTQLQVEALEWKNNLSNPSYLARGAALGKNEQQLLRASGKDPQPTDLQLEYVTASRKDETLRQQQEALQQQEQLRLEQEKVRFEQKARQRQRWVIWAVGIGLVVAIVLGMVAWGQRNQAVTESNNRATAEVNAINQRSTAEAASTKAVAQAQIALSRLLAVQAKSLFASGNSKEMTAVLLAIQSMHMLPSVEAAQILQDNTLAHPIARMKHADILTSIAFSPDGRYVVSGSRDKTARVWEAATGMETVRLTYDGEIKSVAFSPDGKYAVLGGCDRVDSNFNCLQGSARVWDVSIGKEIAHTVHDSEVWSVAFSPDGKFVVSGSEDGTARVWEALTGNEISGMKSANTMVFVSFSPDGKYVVSGSFDGTARVWEAATGKEIARMTHSIDPLMGVAQGVEAVAISPDGKYVVSGSIDNTARVWEALTGQEVARMTHDGGVWSVAFSPDGKYVVSGSFDGTARVWEARTGKEIARMIHDGNVNSVAFSPDGKYVVSGSDDFTARAWEAATGKEISRMMHADVVVHVAFSPDGKDVVSGSSDGVVLVWEASVSKEITRMTHEGAVYSVAFSPDGKYVASGSADGTSRVWESSTGKEVARSTDDGAVYSVAFSPDGKYVVSGSGCKQRSKCDQGGMARVWEISTGKEIARMTYFSAAYSVAFSPDGKYVVSGGCDGDSHSTSPCTQGSARIWEATTGKEIAQLIHESTVFSVAFSPDGKYVVSGDGWDAVHVWEVATEKEITKVEYRSNAIVVNSVAFSPDGKYAVSGYCELEDIMCNRDTARVSVWEVLTGKEIANMLPYDGVNSVAFSPDGKYVVSGGCYQQNTNLTCKQGIVSVWEAATGKEIVHKMFESSVNSVAFSPDGKYVASGSDDGAVRLWIGGSEELMAEACLHVTRNLTRAEWQQYIGDALPYQAVCPDLPIEPDPTASRTPTPAAISSRLTVTPMPPAPVATAIPPTEIPINWNVNLTDDFRITTSYETVGLVAFDLFCIAPNGSPAGP